MRTHYPSLAWELWVHVVAFGLHCHDPMALPDKLPNLLDPDHGVWSYNVQRAYNELSHGYANTLQVLRCKDGESMCLHHHQDHILSSLIPILEIMAQTDCPYHWVEACAHLFGQLLVQLNSSAAGAEVQYVLLCSNKLLSKFWTIEQQWCKCCEGQNHEDPPDWALWSTHKSHRLHMAVWGNIYQALFKLWNTLLASLEFMETPCTTNCMGQVCMHNFWHWQMTSFRVCFVSLNAIVLSLAFSMSWAGYASMVSVCKKKGFIHVGGLLILWARHYITMQPFSVKSTPPPD